MTLDELCEDLDIELEALNITTSDCKLLLQNFGNQTEFTRFEKAAATSFLMQLYNGMENCMKRICKYYRVPVPSGSESHRELADLFTASSTSRQYPQLPILISENIHAELVLLRRFRHVIVHGYSFSIDDHRLKTALMEIVPIPEIFCETIGKFLDSLNADTAT